MKANARCLHVPAQIGNGVFATEEDPFSRLESESLAFGVNSAVRTDQLAVDYFNRFSPLGFPEIKLARQGNAGKHTDPAAGVSKAKQLYTTIQCVRVVCDSLHSHLYVNVKNCLYVF